MQYEISEINDFNEFLGLKNEWNHLLANSYCNIPHLRHEWLRIWWVHFGKPNKIVVIVIRKKGRLVFAIPLMEIQRTYLCKSLTILHAMSNDHSFRYCFIIQYGEEDALKTFFQYLRTRPQNWHLLLLDVPLDISVNDIFINSARLENFRTGMLSYYNSPYLPISGKWEEYLLTLKSKFRSNLRNRTKRLNRIGKVDYELITDSNDIEDALKIGFEIEKKSWKGKSGTAIACDSKLISFYTQLAKVAMEHNWLRISFLKVDDRHVSFDYSLVYQDKMYCLKIGYDPDFYPFSIGQLLCAEILNRCFENNIVEYDFMGWMTKQKSNWTYLSRKHSWIYIFNDSLTSRIYYMYKFMFMNRLKLYLKKWSK